jgi:hypothetical protein
LRFESPSWPEDRISAHSPFYRREERTLPIPPRLALWRAEAPSAIHPVAFFLVFFGRHPKINVLRYDGARLWDFFPI